MGGGVWGVGGELVNRRLHPYSFPSSDVFEGGAGFLSRPLKIWGSWKTHHWLGQGKVIFVTAGPKKSRLRHDAKKNHQHEREATPGKRL